MRLLRGGGGFALPALMAVLCAMLVARGKASGQAAGAGFAQATETFEAPQPDGSDSGTALEEAVAALDTSIDPPAPPTVGLVAFASASPSRQEPPRRSGSRSPPTSA